YYPTATLVTGPDIIFFWVARMIMAGYEYAGDLPFRNVYFTGIVRDKIGRKMSKQLGNSPDPLELIATYGADGVRMGMMLSAPAGNDIMFDDKLCEQGRNFCNKIWNAFRLIKGWEVADEAPCPETSRVAAEWFAARLSETAAEVDDLFGKFRISEALMAVYRLFWDEFSSWYLEMVKPAYGSPIDRQTLDATIGFFDSLLRMLHPFMPFITEELWQNIEPRRDGESIMYAAMPTAGKADSAMLAAMERAKEIIAGVRGVRASKNIPQKELLKLCCVGAPAPEFAELIAKLAGLESIEANAVKDAAAATFMVGTTEFSIPLADTIDVAAEIARIEKDLAYYEGFRTKLSAKLSNERFVANAPAAVVDGERKKLADAETKIASLSEALAGYKSLGK
ncbi:MAG: class I tRNA ligase family protein, partial [Paramuribaculum sp.]|nr:class I tRNA ligase family protein [Paramuribaculum sp.]